MMTIMVLMIMTIQKIFVVASVIILDPDVGIEQSLRWRQKSSSGAENLYLGIGNIDFGVMNPYLGLSILMWARKFRFWRQKFLIWGPKS
eukprot:3973131-Karenia_brevis.AAC.1